MERKKVLFVFLLALGLFSVTARAESDKDVEELLAYSHRIASDLEKPFEKTAALMNIAGKYSDIGQKEKRTFFVKVRGGRVGVDKGSSELLCRI